MISTLPLVALCVLIIEVIAILALWLFPHTIARRLLGTRSAEPAPPASANTWLRMGCALIGLWLLATSVPALMLDTFALSYLSAVEDASPLRRSVFYYLAEVAIGVWLGTRSAGV